jgi:hypothetical protein
VAELERTGAHARERAARTRAQGTTPHARAAFLRRENRVATNAEELAGVLRSLIAFVRENGGAP